jgi:D-arabinose 1-dehydrogenase-like Zn-dependent alcohol dehydrogenase
MLAFFFGLDLRNKQTYLSPCEKPARLFAFRQEGHQGLGRRNPNRLPGYRGFAEMTGVRPMIKKYPLAKAAEGYAGMMSGRAEFRVVLTM